MIFTKDLLTIKKIPEGWYICLSGSTDDELENLTMETETGHKVTGRPFAQGMPGYEKNTGHVFKHKQPQYPQFLKVRYGEQTLLSLEGKELEACRENRLFQYYIDACTIGSGLMTLDGWVVLDDCRQPQVSLEIPDADSRTIPMTARVDLVSALGVEEGLLCGFKFAISLDQADKAFLVFQADGVQEQIPVKKLLAAQQQQRRVRLVRKGLSLAREKGMKALYVKARSYLQERETANTYHDWFLAQTPSQHVLQKQRNRDFKKAPKISLIVAAFNTPLKYFDEMIESVTSQSYENWQLCIADGSTNESVQEHYLSRYQDNEKIRYVRLRENLGISGNMNAAWDLADGDYVGLFDHDDLLTPDCLYEVVKKLQEADFDAVYTDEDKLNDLTGLYMDPHFKPNLSLEQLHYQNYVTHFLVVKNDLLRKLGGLQSRFDGSQDYDLILRISEKTQAIAHVPKILYHWRMHPSSTALDSQSKLYCYQAGQEALEEHLNRLGIDARTAQLPQPYFGCYRAYYPVKPVLISIIVTQTDQMPQTMRFLESLKSNNAWQNYEVILVDGGSKKEETFEAFRKLKGQRGIRITECSSSQKGVCLNHGASYAKGDLLLFASPSSQIVQKETLLEMAMLAQLPGLGAVGCKICDSSRLLKSYGYVIRDKDGIVPAFRSVEWNKPGYMGKALGTSNWSVLSGDFLMVSKDAFVQAGGLKESLGSYGWDWAFCLDLMRLGLRNAATPFGVVQTESSPWNAFKNKEIRTQKSLFEKMYEKELQYDPFYNENFDPVKRPFSLPGK